VPAFASGPLLPRSVHRDGYGWAARERGGSFLGGFSLAMCVRKAARGNPEAAFAVSGPGEWPGGGMAPAARRSEDVSRRRTRDITKRPIPARHAGVRVEPRALPNENQT
jgi:hypothetical protein